MGKIISLREFKGFGAGGGFVGFNEYIHLLWGTSYNGGFSSGLLQLTVNSDLINFISNGPCHSGSKDNCEVYSVYCSILYEASGTVGSEIIKPTIFLYSDAWKTIIASGTYPSYSHLLPNQQQLPLPGTVTFNQINNSGVTGQIGYGNAPNILSQHINKLIPSIYYKNRFRSDIIKEVLATGTTDHRTIYTQAGPETYWWYFQGVINFNAIATPDSTITVPTVYVCDKYYLDSTTLDPGFNIDYGTGPSEYANAFGEWYLPILPTYLKDTEKYPPPLRIYCDITWNGLDMYTINIGLMMGSRREWGPCIYRWIGEFIEGVPKTISLPPWYSQVPDGATLYYNGAKLSKDASYRGHYLSLTCSPTPTPFPTPTPTPTPTPPILPENIEYIDNILDTTPISVPPEEVPLPTPELRKGALKNVYTMVVTPEAEVIGTDSSDNKGTLNTIHSRALSFGPLAPGQTSQTLIIYLKVPSSLAINNIKIALTDCGRLAFGDAKFRVETQTFIDYNIVPSVEFTGVNNTNDPNSQYNINVGNRDLYNSDYVYLNVTIPDGQVLGSGTIRFKWWFDYS